MSEVLDFEKLVNEITKETGRKRKEVLELVAEKKRKFSGLLTDAGAAFMIAKELGIELGLEEKLSRRAKIGELKEGQRNVEVAGRAAHIFSPREVERNGKKRKYVPLVLADESGEIRTTLWGKDTEFLEKKKVERGTALLLKNCFVSSYNEKLQLGLGYNGRIELAPKEVDSELPKAKARNVKIAELGEGMENVDIEAAVLRVFELREFNSDKGKRSVINFEIADDSGTARAVAWGNLALAVSSIGAGKAVKIEGAYAKKGLNGTELHLGWNARILSEPPGVKIPKIVAAGKERRKISELKTGMNAEIFGIVSRISRTGTFNVCGKCGGKAEREGNDFVCRKCGQTEPKKRAFVSLVLDDGEANVNCTFFGDSALSALSLQSEKELDEKAGKAGGKFLLVEGKANENRFDSASVDFIANASKKIDFRSETERLAGEMEKV